jgi:hypothetical protein
MGLLPVEAIEDGFDALPLHVPEHLGDRRIGRELNDLLFARKASLVGGDRARVIVEAAVGLAMGSVKVAAMASLRASVHNPAFGALKLIGRLWKLRPERRAGGAKSAFAFRLPRRRRRKPRSFSVAGESGRPARPAKASRPEIRPARLGLKTKKTPSRGRGGANLRRERLKSLLFQDAESNFGLAELLGANLSYMLR